MAGYTAAQVKELREKTGAGMMDAKNALVEADGDMEKAMELLRQKGLATAAKKSGRAAADGAVASATSDDRQHGVLLELNCETDFVAKGDAFQQLVADLVAQAVASRPADLQAFLDSPAEKLPGQTIKEFVTEKVGQIKENITLRRYQTYAVEGAGTIQSYIHTGGKIGVMVEIGCVNASNANDERLQQFGKDICMQIASFGAEFVQTSDIPQAVIDEETRIEMGKEDLQNKPENIRENIVKGRVNKQLAQKVLMEQAYVKDPSLTIAQYAEQTGNALGDTISIRRFERFVLGEGVEKEETDFAAEVMAQLK